MPRLEASEREAWHMQAEHRVSKGPGLRLANATSLRSSGMHLGHRLLPTRLTSPLPPSSRSLDAARLDRGMPSARVSVWRRKRRTGNAEVNAKTRTYTNRRNAHANIKVLALAYWLGRVPGGITGIRLRAVRGTGGAARARMPSAPSPGLRHGAVGIVARGPPRKLHHSARLLERVSRVARALRKDEEAAVVRSVPALVVPMATAGLRRLDLCMTAVFSREQAFAHTQHTIDAASLHHLLFAAVHQGRVWAARCTNGKLLKAARQLQETCAGRAQLRSAPLRISPVLVAVDARGDEEVMGKGGWWISFRRGPSKMACKLGVIIYVVLQFIAFFSVLIGTGVDMFYIKPEHSFGARVCITLWGGKTDCRKANVTISSDVRWKFCPIRRNNFRIGQAFAIISIFVYGAAFLFGFLLLYCCAGFRWLCLALNIVGAVTACVVWAVMVVTYRLPEPKCLELSDGYDFGTGFGLFVLAWILDIIDIIFLMLPWQIGEFGEARQLHDDALVEEPAELMPAGKTEGAEAADARP
ncbi:Amastin surface glycofamily protein [Leishmania donovani]|uniref:Amastin surface glycofamily protein n=1 Tax=Leishmania donovani TaxID=5661 RepID=A0A504XVB1_LEIDO|nr:Amastin surface glycofamily protein [Leishmania donovani]TPP49086.1 Amastin surface glycofamily protein [Leishmania donovani]TPP49087.1 Amastin surface glycofamily protein [Leishmania donovani]TPP49088.1 Amastin surface glycofamily protein [Leishmania donovani]TPP49089.1 Amastin surface glycofamily protein [Leishmania donovani]